MTSALSPTTNATQPTHIQTKLKRDLLNDGVKISDDTINGVVYAGYDRCVCVLVIVWVGFRGILTDI